MDEDDRSSASSGESERDNENENENENENDADEVMEDADADADEGDNDGEDDGEEDNNDEEGDDEADNDDNDNENDNDNEGDGDGDGDGEGDGDGDNDNDNDNERDQDTQITIATDGGQETNGDGQTEDRSATADDLTERQREKQKASTPKPAGPWRPSVRPEALNARLYDIVPTMAAPQATSVNAMAITPDLRYWLTGGSDGYIRKYDGPGTINGKLALTVAQRHPFVDSVTKAGILMSYWENEEPPAASAGRSEQDHVLSPVYSLAVQSQALWLLSGLESGGINLQSVRHDEGKKICCLQQHSNAVSVLTLAQDEKSVLSGSWDKNIFDWDLNTGQVKRSFDGSGGQISAIELRPASGAPVPAGADELPPSTTMATNNGAPPTMNGSLTNGDTSNTGGSGAFGQTSFGGGDNDGQASPAHESLFGGSDAGSLFGETAGEQPFGNDEDEFNGSMSMMPGHEHEGGMDHSADMAMAGMEPEKESAPAVQPPGGDAMDVDSKPTQPGQTEDGQSGANANGQAPAGSQPGLSPEQLRVAQEIKREDDDGQQGQQNTQTNDFGQPARSPALLVSQDGQPQFDPSQSCPHSFLSTTIDGTIRIWDKRSPNAVARVGNRPGVPPWCMSACWSPDGNMIYAGRRNGTVEEFDVRKARRGWEPERVLKFPAGSGAVSAVKPMVNGRHLVW